MSLKISYLFLFSFLCVASGAHSQILYSASTNNSSVNLRAICEEPDPDTDGDGVCDSMDPCPLDNPDDTDFDGVCDSDDVCPGGNDFQDQDADGVPDLCDICPYSAEDDADGDGVCENEDICVGDDVTGDSDGDGVCDDLDICLGDDFIGDTDGDGICDDLDACIGVNASGNADGDSYCTDLDCDDGDSDTYPGAPDPFGDFIDQDCDGIDGGDADDDGVHDINDNCLTDYNPSQTDSNLDGIGNVCDPMNICTGPAAVLENMLHSTNIYCAAEDSITAGGTDPVPGDVTVSPTGDVVYTAPVINLISSFRVQPGGIFSAGDNLQPAILCSETCPTSNDSDCDDGGPGSDYDSCPLGTDCLDCGPR